MCLEMHPSENCIYIFFQFVVSNLRFYRNPISFVLPKPARQQFIYIKCFLKKNYNCRAQEKVLIKHVIQNHSTSHTKSFHKTSHISTLSHKAHKTEYRNLKFVARKKYVTIFSFKFNFLSKYRAIVFLPSDPIRQQNHR